MGFTIKKAERKNVYVKIALMGSSGSGKTYSGLRMATGMVEEIKRKTGKDAKIAFISTEGSRGYYYANEFDYDIIDLTAPFSPERYIERIDFVVSEGYDVLIIDSTSHEWEGKGGCLELHARAGGRYQDWAKVSPRHDKFIESIANSKIHLIATMRGKDQYDMTKDSNGKTSVQKLGVGAKQRDGFEYEFTCTFNIDQKTNIAETQKDNTHIFDSEADTLLTEVHGAKLIQWATGDEGFNVEVKKAQEEAYPEPVSEKENDFEASEIVEETTNPIEEPEIEITVKDVMTLYKASTNKVAKSNVGKLVKANGYKNLKEADNDTLLEVYKILTEN